MIASIRTATNEDIPQLLELENKSFKGLDRFAYSQFYFAVNIAQAYFRVYEAENGIQGYVYVLTTARIYSIAAHPNQGIGTLLLNSAEDFVRNTLNKKIIKLEVKKNNTNAINFYIKRGYIPIGIKYHYYKDGMNALVMEKDLTQNAKG